MNDVPIGDRICAEQRPCLVRCEHGARCAACQPLRMVWMALPYFVVMTAVGLAAVVWLL